MKAHSHADERKKADLPGDSSASRHAPVPDGNSVAALQGLDLSGDNPSRLRIYLPSWKSPPAADQLLYSAGQAFQASAQAPRQAQSPHSESQNRATRCTCPPRTAADWDRECWAKSQRIFEIVTATPVPPSDEESL